MYALRCMARPPPVTHVVAKDFRDMSSAKTHISRKQPTPTNIPRSPPYQAAPRNGICSLNNSRNMVQWLIGLFRLDSLFPFFIIMHSVCTYICRVSHTEVGASAVPPMGSAIPHSLLILPKKNRTQAHSYSLQYPKTTANPHSRKIHSLSHSCLSSPPLNRIT